MELAERSIREAVEIIDDFLAQTANGKSQIAGDTFRELSRRIEIARSARNLHVGRPAADSAFAAVCGDYRQKLELLRVRLGELEIIFKNERSRLLEEHGRIASTRAWHDLLGTTQR